MSESISISPNISFDQALEKSGKLVEMIANGDLSESQIEEIVSLLVASVNGSRSFFANYLTTDYDFANTPSPAILKALSSSSTIVSDILVKNLAMSTASALTHQRNGDLEQSAGSLIVQQRTLNLLSLLKLPESGEKISSLALTIKNGTGDYQGFLERWGYDTEQKEAIAKALVDVIMGI